MNHVLVELTVKFILPNSPVKMLADSLPLASGSGEGVEMISKGDSVG